MDILSTLSTYEFDWIVTNRKDNFKVSLLFDSPQPRYVICLIDIFSLSLHMYYNYHSHINEAKLKL